MNETCNSSKQGTVPQVGNTVGFSPGRNKKDDFVSGAGFFSSQAGAGALSSLRILYSHCSY